MVLVVPDELHHRRERERVREAVFPISVVDLDQLVVSVFPGGGEKWQSDKIRDRDRLAPLGQMLSSSSSLYLNVSVKSPCSFVDASRTMKEPSGVSRSFSFTSSLRDDKITVSTSSKNTLTGQQNVFDGQDPLPSDVSPVPLCFL